MSTPALFQVPSQLVFEDGVAELVSRNGFLDIKVRSCGEEQVRRRASSVPPCFKQFELEVDEGKPFTRSITDRTVSTDYRDLDASLDTEFERQITQQSVLSSCCDDSSPISPISLGSAEQPELNADWESLHTVMIKNIPCRCSAGEVLRAVDSVGFAGTYDFFYLPMNRRHKQGIGYAFINFTETGTALAFKEAIWGYRFPGRKSTKEVQVAAAQLQGREEAEAYFSRTQVVHTRFRPIM